MRKLKVADQPSFVLFHQFHAWDGTDRAIFFVKHALERKHEDPNRNFVPDKWIAEKLEKAANRIIKNFNDTPSPGYKETYFVVCTTPWNQRGTKFFFGVPMRWQVSAANDSQVRAVTDLNFGKALSFIVRSERTPYSNSSADTIITVASVNKVSSLDEADPKFGILARFLAADILEFEPKRTHTGSVNYSGLKANYSILYTVAHQATDLDISDIDFSNVIFVK